MKKKLSNHIDEYLKIRAVLTGIPVKKSSEILKRIAKNGK